jgi:hypothetical protein
MSSHTHGDPTNQFTAYNRGTEVFDELSLTVTLMDERVRNFMEESDSAQVYPS